MIKIKLPFWLGGAELTKLVAAAQSWWETVTGWLRWPYSQIDPDTCHLSILELWAWQRDVTRFTGEPRNRIFQEMRWEPPERLATFDFVDGDRDFLRALTG